MLLKKNIPFKYTFGKVHYEGKFGAIYATLILVWDKFFHVINILTPLSVSMVLGIVLSLLLAFTLLNTFGVMEISMVVTIALTFFLIEKMAIHLHDPCENKPTDTPVTAIAKTIERNLKQMINNQMLPEKADLSEYYVL